MTLQGQYEIVAAIARGGMGRVYRAVQLALGRDVALKLLDMEQLEGQGKDFQQRFFNEAAACAKLVHPNTVVVYDYGKTDDEIYFIAMELLAGPTLQDVIAEAGVIEPARAMHIAMQICGSIGEAHERGMVHRDLKPSNVMLTPRGNDPDFVKVLDFGLVKHEDNGLTQSGTLLGTPRYMAPEQITADHVGPAADIYSLGAILYHMLTGRPPFDSESKFVLLASHMNVAAPPIREVRPDSPASDELERVVMRCLLKDPSARYESMEALARALAFCPEDTTTARSSMPRSAGGVGTSGPKRPDPLGSTSAARPSSAREQALAVPLTAPNPAEAVAPPRRRGVMTVLVAAITTGAVLAAGAFFAFRSSDESDAPNPVAEITEELARPDPTAREVAPVETPVTSRDTRVLLQSEPTGARVRRDGADLGDAPLTLVLPAGETWTVDVSASGYESRTVSLTGGQQQVHVSLQRRRRGGGGRTPTREATPEPEMAAVAMEPVVEPAMAMEAVMSMTGTDNRDPWAR